MITEYIVRRMDEREAVLAMSDDELLDWLSELRPMRIGGTWFKRLPWSDDIVMADEQTTVAELRQQIRDAKAGRRKEVAG